MTKELLDNLKKKQDKELLDKFYALYTEGREEESPQGYIDYFKARKFLLNVFDQVRSETAEAVAREMTGNLKFIHKQDNHDYYAGYNLRIKEEKSKSDDILNSLKE